MQRAERRWRALEHDRPDLAPAIELQRALVHRSIAALRRLEAGPDARLSFPHAYLRTKLTRGVPALRGETIPPAVDLLAPLLGEYADLLANHGGGEAPRHIREALDAGAIEPASWLAAILARDQAGVRRGAHQLGLAPDLVWLIGELATAPLAHLLARNALASAGPDGTALGDDRSIWSRGTCPACGSWPALAEATGDRRRLRCAFCGSAWALSDRRCVYCATGELTKQVPTADTAEAHLDLCSACGGYLKVVSVSEPLHFPLATIEDLATTSLDELAMQRGYGRPPLPDADDDDGDRAGGGTPGAPDGAP